MANPRERKRSIVAQRSASDPDIDDRRGKLIEGVIAELDAISDHALEQVERCVKRFTEELVREAARIEMGERATGADKPEITATMILKAEKLLRSGPGASRVRRSRVTTAVLVVSTGSSLAAATQGTYLNSRWQLVAFLGLLLIAITSNTVVYVRGRS